jgi:hypothetical protein
MNMIVIRAVYSLVASISERIDRKHGWHNLGRLDGTITLFGLRHRLRERNLYDAPAVDPPDRAALPPRVTVRTIDGRGTDVCGAEMGAVGAYFGRNGPAFPSPAGLPDPREISEKLLARTHFQPAKGLNLLAAAWVQFEVHDWMQHGVDPEDNLIEAERSPRAAPRFVSAQTHWWDASQLYGADKAFTTQIRAANGRVKVGDELLQVIEESATLPAPPVPNAWLGLALFHLAFAREHNWICDVLEQREPQLNLHDQTLFDKARLINAAVMAKIHTVEWTPAVIAHPTTEHAIRATWWGVLGPGMRRWGRVGSGEVLSGIPGSPRTHHDGVRYSLTEEFVAVYRMHPLIPDEVTFRHVDDDSPLDVEGRATLGFEELAMAGGPPDRLRTLVAAIGEENAFYSLGLANPGLLELHNYPEFLRRLPRIGKAEIDLAARDIERSRECALPRYNDFRRVFRLRPADTFVQLTGDKASLAADIASVYDRVDDVDLMAGLFAEPKPSGFAFSDTAFRVFLLMAARRLRSDRFFTTDFTSDVYTPTGLALIRQATMSKLLARHYSTLRPALEGVKNVFKPWASRW